MSIMFGCEHVLNQWCALDGETILPWLDLQCLWETRSLGWPGSPSGYSGGSIWGDRSLGITV